jgi:hypothetical protein
MQQRSHALVLAAVLAVLAAVPVSLRPAAAAATACPATRPTWVGGTFRGSDGRAINAHIGVGLKNAAGADVLEDGSLRPPGEGYSFIQRFNPTVPATGTTDPAAVRTWGRCVAANVVRSFIEIYPKRPAPDPITAPTDYSRYGLGSYYFLRVTAGARLDVLLRTPLIYQLGGNTGGVQGYITRGGRPVPPAYITRVRAFTRQPGSACGVEGMAAIANRLLTGSSGRTYYLVDFLAAGQCGAPYQTYTLRVTCGPPACGSVPVTALRRIDVVRGRWPRLDVAF